MPQPQSLYNVNVGVLGHVDSGKTSLVAALSTTLSTAALDKHPQSRERGITLDLGFSSFTLPAPSSITSAGFDAVQFTLVDCPGHASLIRTVIGGAQIMDLMILVIDVTKGIQTQTAECIVLGEITTDQMIVVLNKIDQLQPEKREKHIKKAKKLVAETLAATKFAKCPMVAVSALSSSSSSSATETVEPGGLEDLKQALLDSVALHPRVAIPTNSTTKQAKYLNKTPFLFFIDHCFAIKGQGTVLTGTVARGKLSIGDTLELPALKQQRKVKSMQMFRRPVSSCQQGDRVGICVTQLEAGAVERGIAASPGSIPTFTGAVVQVEKVRFYPGLVKSGSKMHVIVGHQTVMAKILFFGTPRSRGSTWQQQQEEESKMESLSVSTSDNTSGAFNYSNEYLYQDELYGIEGRPARAELFGDGGGEASNGSAQPSSVEDHLVPSAHYGPQWAVVQFDEPVTAPPDSLIIGARLDADLHAAACRIALSGHIQSIFDYSNTRTTNSSSQQLLHQLKVYKLKQRLGTVERVESDGCTAICRGMFGKESDLTRFIGMTVRGGMGGSTTGVLEGSFGKSGKFKVRFNRKILMESKLANQGVVLEYKRFVFDADKRRIAQ
ncbi:hypothetical protein Ndes2526A_g05477 [Nannochloris sp. 'desiccata']